MATLERHAHSIHNEIIRPALEMKFNYTKHTENQDLYRSYSTLFSIGAAAAYTFAASTLTGTGFLLALGAVATGAGVAAVALTSAIFYLWGENPRYDANWRETFATAIIKKIESKEYMQPRERAVTASRLYTKAFEDCVNLAVARYKSVLEQMEVRADQLRGHMGSVALLGRIELVCNALISESKIANLSSICSEPISRNAYCGVYETNGTIFADKQLVVKVPHSIDELCPLEVFMHNRARLEQERLRAKDVSAGITHIYGGIVDQYAVLFPMDFPRTENPDVGLRLDSAGINTWFAVERCGVTLEAYVTEAMAAGTYSWRTFENISWQLFNILRALMSASINHRSFSADNIVATKILSDNNIPEFVIMDFSVACLDGTSDTKEIGSYFSTAPEQWGHSESLGLSGYGRGIDVFSFGITLWEMMPKRRFVRGNHVLCRDAFPIDAPAGLKELIHRCLHPDTIKRAKPYNIVKDLEAISAAIAGRNPVALKAVPNSCVICSGVVAVTPLAPCAHIPFCAACALSAHECPTCQGPIDGRDEAYFTPKEKSWAAEYGRIDAENESTARLAPLHEQYDFSPFVGYYIM